MAEIVNAWIVYGKPRQPMDFYAFGEQALMQKHLDALMGRSMVEIKGNQYYRT
jgi:hypothetical protein